MDPKKHMCCGSGHCCVLHGCKYGHEDCPVVTEEIPQEGGCEDCGLLREGYYEPEPEFDDAPYGCPRCGSTRIVFSSAYDIPKGQRPKMDDPIRYFVLCLACKHEGPWAEFKGHKDREARRGIMANPFNMGHLIEGVVEQDPLTDKFYIRTMSHDGKAGRFEIQDALSAHLGKEVRFTLVSFENLARLASLVEQGGATVAELGPDGLPGFNVERKPE